MFRVPQAVASHTSGRLIAALVAAAAIGLPAAESFAGDRGGGWYRRGHSSHSHRGHNHGHRHHHHSHSGVSLRIGLPPIIIGDRCDPPVIYRERRVVVREPAPVIVQQPQVIYQQPAPVVVQQPAPVVVQRPAPVIVQQPAPQPAAQPVVVTAQTTPLPSQVNVPAPAPDVVPANLTMQAFRSGGTIMVHISGVNSGGTYNTTLTTGDLGLASPSVVLRNIQTSADAAAPDTAFNVSLALNITRPVTTVTVRFADQAHQVPIVDVPTTQ